MTSAYFRQRMIQALCSARQAKNEQERQIHLRTCRYYRDLSEASARRS